MFIRRDLFSPGSKFVQVIDTGTCKFMQIHTIIMLAYYYFIYSLSGEFSTKPRCSSTPIPSLGPEYSSFMTFLHSLSLRQEVAWASKKQINPA